MPDENLNEAPLFTKTALSATRRPRPLRTRLDWALLSTTLLVSLTPLVVGLYYTLLAAALTLDGEKNLWGVPITLIIFILSLSSPLLSVYSFMEAKKKLSIAALILACLCWPLLAISGVWISS